MNLTIIDKPSGIKYPIRLGQQKQRSNAKLKSKQIKGFYQETFANDLQKENFNMLRA